VKRAAARREAALRAERPEPARPETASAAPALPRAAPAAKGRSPSRGRKDPAERALAALLTPRRSPPGLGEPWAHLREFATRPGKRLRPKLVTLGWRAGGGADPAPEGLARFAAALELLHAFFLVHDDIADDACTRRGGPALHRVLGDARLGEQLAVVAGDLLFVEAIDAMLGCGLPGAATTTREVLAACRETASGQYLDIAFTGKELADVSCSAARQAELLKTARYSFEAPLVAGAMLAGARPEVLGALRKVARPLGLAFQLQDDLLPFGLGDAAGKPALADLAAGKKTWLLLLTWRALDEVGRARLRACLAQPDAASLVAVRRMVTECGALAQVEREVRRLCARARRAAAGAPLAEVARALDGVIAMVEAMA
jgi:geranylgeranyl diphosphate synthase type I